MGKKKSSNPEDMSKSASKEPSQLPIELTDLAFSYSGMTTTGVFSSNPLRLGPGLLKKIVNVNIGLERHVALIVAKKRVVIRQMLERYPQLIDYRADPKGGYWDALYPYCKYKNINALELALKLPLCVDLALEIYQIVSDGYMNSSNLTTNEKALASEGFHRMLSLGFLEHVAKGNQEAAEVMLKQYPNLLNTEGSFSDHAGRTFNCTAYEYANIDVN